MKLDYTKTAQKDIRKLPPEQRKKILKKLKILTQLPLSGKKLEGEYKDQRVIRAWPYRIIYEIRGNTIYVLTVKHRQGAYN
jgi:mRNA-degrading endonuclease RelE of RelBE toxin-antitoxin system